MPPVYVAIVLVLVDHSAEAVAATELVRRRRLGRKRLRERRTLLERASGGFSTIPRRMISQLRSWLRLKRPSDRPDASLESAQLQVMLAEYATLREEVLAAIGHRVTTMNFTFAATSVLLAGLLTRKVPDSLAGPIAFFAVPQFAHAGLLIWLGEYRRSQRASMWLSNLEKRINAAVGMSALGWESRSDGESAEQFAHMGFPYIANAALLLGAAYVALGLGGYLIVQGLEDTIDGAWLYAIVFFLALYALVTEGAYLRFFRQKWQESRVRRKVS